MKKRDWVLTKICKTITVNEKDFYTKEKLNTKNIIKFRILDDDKVIYAYGIMDKDWFDEDNYNGFEPADYFLDLWGTTEIQLKIDGEYVTL